MYGTFYFDGEISLKRTWSLFSTEHKWGEIFQCERADHVIQPEHYSRTYTANQKNIQGITYTCTERIFAQCPI